MSRATEGKRVLDPADEVVRSRLLQFLDVCDSSLIVLSAPSGYGKSVLAAQYAAKTPAETVEWIDCSHVDGSEAHLLATIIDHLSGSSSRRHEDVLLSRSLDDHREKLRQLLVGRDDPTLLVLDGMNMTPGCELLWFVADVVYRSLGGGRTLVTTRALQVDSLGRECRLPVVLGADELRMSDEEVERLAECFLGHANRTLAMEAQDIAFGHAATLSLFLRASALHWRPGCLPGTGANSLVSQAVQAAVGQLSGLQRDALEAAFIMRRGSIAELQRVVPGLSVSDLSSLSECLPLFRISGRDLLTASFELHELVIGAMQAIPQMRLPVTEGVRRLRSRAFAALDERGDEEAIFRHLLADGMEDELLDRLQLRGDILLKRCSYQLLESAISRLSAASLLRSPKALLLRAELLRRRSSASESKSYAIAARDLAGIGDDADTYIRATLHLVRMCFDDTEYEQAIDYLRQLDAHTETVAVDSATRMLINAYLVAALAASGKLPARSCIASLAADTLEAGHSSESKASVLNCLVFAAGRSSGDMPFVRRVSAATLGLQDLPMSLRANAQNSLMYALMEMGRCRRVLRQSQRLLREYQEVGALLHIGALHGLRYCAALGVGDMALASDERSLVEADTVIKGDMELRSYQLLSNSLEMLALGQGKESLECAEEAMEQLEDLSSGWLRWLAVLQVAAGMLACGSTPTALAKATAVRKEAAASEALYHVLRADMILAEIARLEGRHDEATALFAAHEEYILTESSNWQIGMYVRAFPHLLGYLANAIEPDVLPSHLLGMVLPRDAERTLVAAAEVMDRERWRRLSLRVIGEAGTRRLEVARNAPLCTVRLFGALEVHVGDRVVSDRSWRKRKARLVFAMLAARVGGDVSREQIIEQLWPDMPVSRGKNNFYVVWSAMKAALVPGAGRDVPCPYVDSVGGVCRASAALVRTDLQDFDRALEDARDARQRGKTDEALDAYQRMFAVYQGELLPGDLYEDWFSALRDRCRRDFSDSMMEASRILVGRGDHDAALRLLRRALEHDPWREDLYQAALRSHIAVGQRGPAIETYLACREKLSEDLGLDPSSETRRLYDEVLAMEEPDPCS